MDATRLFTDEEKFRKDIEIVAALIKTIFGERLVFNRITSTHRWRVHHVTTFIAFPIRILNTNVSNNRLNDRLQKTDFQSHSLRRSLINKSYRVVESLNTSEKKRIIASLRLYFRRRSLRGVSTANSSTLHHGTGSRNEITTAVNDIRYGRWDRTNLITSRSHRSSFHLPVQLALFISLDRCDVRPWMVADDVGLRAR